VEYLKYLGSIITNDGRRRRERKSRIAIAKAKLGKKTLFTCKFDLELRKKVVKCYMWSVVFYDAENWDTSESRSEVPEKF
jgi:hypothetical protein